MNESRRAMMKLGLVLSGGPMILTACGGGSEAETSSGAGVSNSSGSSETAANEGRNALVTGNVATNFNSSSGDLGGINVSAGGRSTTTNGSGAFRLDDVIPGAQEVAFESERDNSLSKQKLGVATFNAEIVRGSITVDIPEGGRVDLQNVRIQGNVVVADQIVTTNADGVSTTISGGTLPAPDLPQDTSNTGTDSSTNQPNNETEPPENNTNNENEPSSVSVLI